MSSATDHKELKMLMFLMQVNLSFLPFFFSPYEHMTDRKEHKLNSSKSNIGISIKLDWTTIKMQIISDRQKIIFKYLFNQTQLYTRC